MVADGGAQPAGTDIVGDRLRDTEVGSERLLDEERQASLERRPLQRPVCERRDAQPHCVEVLGGEQGQPVAIGAAAQRLSGSLGPLEYGVGDSDEFDLGDAVERGEVPAGDEACPHAGDLQAAHPALVTGVAACCSTLRYTAAVCCAIRSLVKCCR